MKYLSVGTYPRHPATQGGRLRLDAMHRILNRQGWKTLHLWVGPPTSEGLRDDDRQATGLDQIGVVYSGAFERFLREGGRRPDVASNQFLRDDSFAWQRFREAILSFDPDVIAVEQAMLWPSLERYLTETSSRRSVKLVYSSHNVEHRLFQDEAMLRSAKVNKQAVGLLLEAEMALAAEADLVVTASEADCAYFCAYAHEVLLAPNGCWPRTARPGGKGALFVSSAHPHNVEGFMDYLGEALVDLAPGQSVTVVGGACDPLRARCPNALSSGRLSLRGRVDNNTLGEMFDAHALILLPISGGGGTNIKTAEALATGKTILGTPTAFRGFERYTDQPRVHIEASSEAYRLRLRELLSRPDAYHMEEPTDASSLSWDNCFTALSASLLEPNRYGWSLQRDPVLSAAGRLWVAEKTGWTRDEYGVLRMSGNIAEVMLELDAPLQERVAVILSVSAFADAHHPVKLTVTCGRGTEARATLEWPNLISEMQIEMAPAGRSVRFSFECDGRWSLADLGISASTCKRGVALHAVRISAA